MNDNVIAPEREVDITLPIGRNRPLEFAIDYIVRNRRKTTVTVHSQHYIWCLLYGLARPMREHDRELSDMLLHIADELRENDKLLNRAGGAVRVMFRSSLFKSREFHIWDTFSLIRFMETLSMQLRREDIELSDSILHARDRIEDNYDHNTAGALVVAEYFCE